MMKRRVSDAIFETVVAAVIAVVLFSIWFGNDDWRE
jgi:hypothetical protein